METAPSLAALGLGGGQAGTPPLCKLLPGIFGDTAGAERRGSPFPSENCLVLLPPLTLPAGGTSCLPKAGSCSPGPRRGPRMTQRGTDGPPGSLGASSRTLPAANPARPGKGVVRPKQPRGGGVFPSQGLGLPAGLGSRPGPGLGSAKLPGPPLRCTGSWFPREQNIRGKHKPTVVKAVGSQETDRPGEGGHVAGCYAILISAVHLSAGAAASVRSLGSRARAALLL